MLKVTNIIYCHILLQSNIYGIYWKITRLRYLRKTVNLNEMKRQILDIIDSQRCYKVMKTHRTKLRVEMNNKNGVIKH